MMNLIIKFSLILLFFYKFNYIYSQSPSDDNPFYLKGLQYGFNFGVLFPSSKTANYYNGDQSNTLSLKRAIIDSGYWNGSVNYTHKEIREKVFNGDDFEISELPLKMKYSVATNIGFYVKENIKDNIGVFLEFNFAKLTAEDKFSLERRNMPPGSIVEPYFFKLYAKESRVDINLGISKSFGTPQRFKPFASAGLNMNNTKVLSADALIGDSKYSYLNPYNEYYGIRDYGIGYGVLLGGGLQIIASQSLLMHTGIDFSLKKINLGDNKKYNLNTVFYIRLLFKSIISTKPDE